MKNKTYMLPNRFRKCGYGLIIASVLSLVLGLLMANVWEIIPQAHTRFISMVMYLLFFLGIFVILMTEDHYGIHRLRILHGHKPGDGLPARIQKSGVDVIRHVSGYRSDRNRAHEREHIYHPISVHIPHIHLEDETPM